MHYDIAIIGTGTGGGTLLHALAGRGKRILVLEAATTCRAKKRTGIPAR
jgi:choline dehydrogenase-like flavoprotein